MDEAGLPRDITREKLYDLVWQTPMSQLCEEFGLSGRGLGKLCKRWNVPVPPRGYWRRLETGGTRTRTPLPPDSRPLKIRITPSPKRPVPKGLPALTVPDRLSSPHELVRRTRENWAANKPLEPTSLDLRVSKEARSRALRIADTVLKELERRGHSVVVHGYRKTYAVIEDETVGFYIEERFTRHETVLTEEEKKRHVYKPRFEFVPSGRLSLRICGYSRDIQHGWSDGVRRKIEAVLPEFLDGLTRYAEKEKVRRRERLEDERRYAAMRRLREEEERRVRELDDHLRLWRAAAEMKEYLAFAESIHGATCDSEWIGWVRGRLAACEEMLRGRITKAGVV